ncbi:HNH endonuclease [Corynebacterium aquatimens]|uniref:HNH endonuclease signature motif containing protein n=1 Tax=Corynebacterium TaxID=1716 RepID=UPI001F1F5DA5|nr:MULTISPECIES: HNH endonuclease signature motif containing protein [Corynebacterium]QYH19150.1 HNH endonuclease [Corynebacterium aquatimens]UIZ91975.1 HNH endonuclease [Corynebacterium sp. CNCTC7651]
MNLMSFLEAMASSPLDLLAGFDVDQAVALGIEPTKARTWAELYDVYLGTTHAHKQQKKAVALVAEAGVSLDELVFLERHLKKVAPQERGRKRLDVLSAVASARPKTFNAFTRAVKAAAPIEPKPPKKGAFFTRSRHKMRGVTMWMDEHRAAEWEHFAREGIDETQSAAPQMLAKLDALFSANASGEGGQVIPAAVPRPIVSVPLPDWVDILEGRGEEVVLGLTDGTTITGAEFIERFVAAAENHLELALVKPGYGAVNLYDTSRFANEKQRTLASLVNPVCPWPGCKSPAVHNQAHHVTPWKQGGHTNLNNLVMVCRYHNHVNDDDVGRHKRGRVEMRGGEGIWISPRGVPVRNDYHPYGVLRGG